MASRQPSLLVVSVIVALAQGCGDVVIEPLAPPPAGLVARLRDSAVAGEMTWVDVSRPPSDTGALTFRSSDPAVLVVEADGRAFPLKAGRATVSVASPGLTASIDAAVRTRADGWQVTFRFTWAPSDAEQELFLQAAMRWQRALRQSAATTTDVPAGACRPGAAAERITQQGITVWVDRFADGTVAPGVTGTADQCIVDEQGRTRVGAMAVRRSFSDQAAGLTALERITWENQFVHQLGQTLGLAGLTVFGVPRPELDLSNPAAPRWTWSGAVNAYRLAGGFEAGVPITADLNFWQDDLGTGGDVMLPAITAERRVTSVTLGALADRGYLTESIRAEPPPLPAAGPSFVLRTAPWRGSIWVARTGRVAERVR